jgi:hypothetical protein
MLRPGGGALTCAVRVMVVVVHGVAWDRTGDSSGVVLDARGRRIGGGGRGGVARRGRVWRRGGRAVDGRQDGDG